MSTEEAERREMCRLFLGKSERALKTAARLLADTDYEFVSSRAYYAVYYAVQAAMCSKGIVLVRHAGVISEFGRVFIKTGVFPREFSKYVHRLHENRHLADYDVRTVLEEETARKDVSIATTVTEAIKEYLVENGFLPA